MVQHQNNYSVFPVEIQVFRGDMVNDLQDHRDGSTDHQNDTTEWENSGLTTRLDNSHNSSKQKAPVLADKLC